MAEIKLKDERIEDFIMDRPYLDYDADAQIWDYSLGLTLEDAGQICRQILILQNRTAQN